MTIYKGTKRIAGLYHDVDIEYATEAHAGIIKIATQEDVLNGVDNSKAVTPSKLKYVFDTNLENYDISKVEDYLYTIHYNTSQLDYQYAIDYFLNNYYNITFGGCSSLKKGNYFGRNYDWYYSNSVSFVVKKEASAERYASIGMAGGLQSLTKDIVESKEWKDIYKILPFFLLDGINEHGVTVSMNVVPVDQKGKTTGTHPESQGDNICMLMLPSYILDNFKTAQDAINWILNEGKIYAPYNETVQQELHFLIADKDNTFVVEFVNNSAVLIDNKNYITNFYLHGAEFSQDNKVDYNTVTPYGQGLERYNKIAEFYDSLNSQNDILNFMRTLNYTNSYNVEDLQNWWKTEFVAPYQEKGEPFPNLTVTTPVDEFVSSGLVDLIEEKFNTRTRENESTWQTIHTSVYDIGKKQFLLLTQEQDITKVRTFQLFNTIGDGKLIIKQNDNIVGEYSANQSLDTEIVIQGGGTGASEFSQLLGSPYDNENLATALNEKQDTLVSGTNIKTLNNESLLGEGNIDITSAQWGNIQGELSNQTDLSNSLQNVREVAEGKTKSYVVSYADNPIFNSQNAEIKLDSTFTDINGIIHNIEELKLGDNIFVQETDVPDRWCSQPSKGESILPEDYTQLEYIESTGTQYIDTGIIFDTLDTKVEIGIDVISANKDAFGFSNPTRDTNWYALYTNNFQAYFGTTGSNVLGNLGSGISGVKRDIVLTTDANKRLQVKVNNLLQIDKNFTGDYIVDNQKSFAILTANGNLTTSRCTSSQLWYTRLYKNDTLVFNGIPAKRNSDETIGMYDLVSSTFFTNAGTGTFIAGGVIEKSVTLYKLETSKVDLTEYATIGDLATKQDVLTAGTGIDITNNVISNTQTSAEWGNIQGELSNQTDLQTALDNKQNKLTAGNNIKIENDEISVTGDLGAEIIMRTW